MSAAQIATGRSGDRRSKQSKEDSVHGARSAQRVVETVYAAFAADDLPGIRQLLADDLRWRQAAAAVPAAGVDGHGADAFVTQVIQAIRTDWEGFTEQVEALLVADDVVTATGTYHGTFRPTGRRLSAEFCHLWVVQDGMVRRFRQYTDTAAFAAAESHGE